MTLSWGGDPDTAVAVVDVDELLDRLSQAFRRVTRAGTRAGLPQVSASVIDRASEQLETVADELEQLSERVARIEKGMPRG